jgi:hypothetical protein
VAHVVIKLLAVFTAVRIGKNISTARIAFDSTHEWHGEEQKNRASVKDHHRPFWPSKVFRRRLLGLLRTKPLGQDYLGTSAAVQHNAQKLQKKSTCERKPRLPC